MAAAQLKQRQLLARLLGLEAAYNYEAIAARPARGLVAELGDLNAAAWGSVVQVSEPALDGAGQAGNYDEAGLLSFEPFNQAMIVKPFVGADYNRSHARRNLGEAGFEKVEDAAGGMDVTGPQFPMPEVAALALEAKQRMVGGSPSLDGVVADTCLLLFSINHEHGGVHVQDGSRLRPRTNRESMKKAVVQSAQLWKRFRSGAQQEPPQARSIRIAGQSGQILEHAVLAQQLSGLDPFETEHHRIQQSEKHLAHTVAIVALRELDILTEGPFETDASQEAMKEIDSSVVRQGGRTEGYSELARSSGHFRQKLPKR